MEIINPKVTKKYIAEKIAICIRNELFDIVLKQNPEELGSNIAEMFAAGQVQPEKNTEGGIITMGTGLIEIEVDTTFIERNRPVIAVTWGDETVYAGLSDKMTDAVNGYIESIKKGEKAS